MHNAKPRFDIREDLMVCLVARNIWCWRHCWSTPPVICRGWPSYLGSIAGPTSNIKFHQAWGDPSIGFLAVHQLKMEVSQAVGAYANGDVSKTLWKIHSSQKLLRFSGSRNPNTFWHLEFFVSSLSFFFLQQSCHVISLWQKQLTRGCTAACGLKQKQKSTVIWANLLK